MKRNSRSRYLSGLFAVAFWITALSGRAQDNIYPAAPQQQDILLTNARIHTGTGKIIEKGAILIRDGRIAAIGAPANPGTGVRELDLQGKEVYPGLILANTDLGLKEIGSGVRGSNDYFELGELNPSVSALYAYNADSRIINTLRTNGILLAHIVPRGNLLSGISSVVQLDAWDWEDALYRNATGMHLQVPRMMGRAGRSAAGAADPLEKGMEQIRKVEQMFTAAQAYFKTVTPEKTNLKLEALRPLFERKQKLFVHADRVRQILVAVEFARNFDIPVVLVGGSDSYLITDMLKQYQIPVILNTMYTQPAMEDDDIDQPFKTPALLQQAGLLYAINDNDASARYRNLAFNAGMACSYGLSKEQALQAITLNAARILGIADRTGSLEPGKDANLIVCEGDLLDIRSSIIKIAFIQGRQINLENKQTQLYERYLHRYGLDR
ncbi:amidohydrolase [Niabella terrae]